MGVVDKVHAAHILKAQQRAHGVITRRRKANEEMQALSIHVVLTSDSSAAEETDEDRDSVDLSSPAASKRARINIMSPGVAAALD